VKKEVSGGLVAAIVGGVVVVIGLFYLIQWMGGGGGQSASDREIEKMHVEQAKSEYGRYQNPGAGSSGPPVSGEGEAQAAAPGGVPTGH
jgi:hypothetical protein